VHDLQAFKPSSTILYGSQLPGALCHSLMSIPTCCNCRLAAVQRRLQYPRRVVGPALRTHAMPCKASGLPATDQMVATFIMLCVLAAHFHTSLSAEVWDRHCSWGKYHTARCGP
jgi:hypothetical protein